MSVPNHKHIVQGIYNKGTYNLRNKHDRDRFVDDAVYALHSVDRRWGFLKKKPGQTQVHGHSEDGAVYLSDEPGRSCYHVDFGGGFGGDNPSIAWSVDRDPLYSKADWLDPKDHDAREEPKPAPPPPAPALKSREQFSFEIRQLNGFYASGAGLQRPGGMVKYDYEGRTIADVEAMEAWCYSLMAGTPLQDCIRQIRQSGEWRGKHPNETP
jgi:hypothetical protein